MTWQTWSRLDAVLERVYAPPRCSERKQRQRPRPAHAQEDEEIVEAILPARLGRTLPLLCRVECHTKTSRMILLKEEFGLQSPIETCDYRGCYRRVPSSETSNSGKSTLLAPGKVILSAVYVAIALGMVTMRPMTTYLGSIPPRRAGAGADPYAGWIQRELLGTRPREGPRTGVQEVQDGPTFR